MPPIVHWNLRLRLAPKGVLWRVPRLGRENSFGDLLGPWIVARICETLNLGRAVSNKHRLLTVGSIISSTVARDVDIVWGSGFTGISCRSSARSPGSTSAPFEDHGPSSYSANQATMCRMSTVIRHFSSRILKRFPG